MFMKIILKSNILKLYQQATKSNENYPACKEPTQYISSVDYVFRKQLRARLKAAFHQKWVSVCVLRPINSIGQAFHYGLHFLLR